MRIFWQKYNSNRLAIPCRQSDICTTEKRKAGTYYEKWNQIYTGTKAKTKTGEGDWQNTWNSTAL